MCLSKPVDVYTCISCLYPHGLHSRLNLGPIRHEYCDLGYVRLSLIDDLLPTTNDMKCVIFLIIIIVIYFCVVVCRDTRN